MNKEELKELRIKRRENHQCVHCGKQLPEEQTRETCNQCYRIGQLANGEKGWRWKLNREVFDAYGNKCSCCGETNQFFLTLDHKEGGGNIHRKEVRKMGSNDWYKWVIENDFPNDFQLLCYNCLGADTGILMADNTTRKLYDLVNKKSTTLVKSFNIITNKIEDQPIVGWYKEKFEHVEWYRIITANSKPYRNGYYGINMTFDHKIYTKNLGMTSLCKVNINDSWLVPIPTLSEIQYQVIIGSLLGDGSLTKTRSINNAFFRTANSKKQKEYLIWKWSILSNLTSNIYIQMNNRSIFNRNKSTIMYCFNTKSLPVFTELYRRFYTPHKIISEYDLKQLGPLGLAVWFMDDGALEKSSDCIRLHTESFLPEDVDKLIDFLYQYYHIDSTKYRTNYYSDAPYKQYIISINRINSSKLMSIIAPFIHTSIRYKIPDRYKNQVITESYNNLINNIQEYSYDRIIDIIKINSKNIYSNYKFCIEVANNHNFFTTQGLVSNCNLGRERNKGICPHVDERLKD